MRYIKKKTKVDIVEKLKDKIAIATGRLEGLKDVLNLIKSLDKKEKANK